MTGAPLADLLERTPTDRPDVLRGRPPPLTQGAEVGLVDLERAVVDVVAVREVEDLTLPLRELVERGPQQSALGGAEEGVWFFVLVRGAVSGRGLGGAAEVCQLAVSNGGKLFGIGLSFEAFDAAIAAGHDNPFDTNYWLASAMFTSALVQKKMQGVSNSKGLTVLIMDDNQKEMPKLSGGLYTCEPWYDGLYQCAVTKKGKRVWVPRKPKDRFDQIINTAFAIKSDHSSLVQVADAISYVYRRHLELKSADEAYAGEQAYYQSLIDILEPRREKIGQTPDAPCVSFYQAARHQEWAL